MKYYVVYCDFTSEILIANSKEELMSQFKMQVISCKPYDDGGQYANQPTLLSAT